MNRKGQAIRENIERAFDEYCAQGGNKVLTLRALEAAGHKLSRPTLYRWIEEYNFDERMARADIKRQGIETIARDAIAELFLDLMDMKERYERFFAAQSDGRDPGTGPAFAYTGIVREIARVAAKLAPASAGAGEDEEARIQRARLAMEEEYGITR